MLSINAWNVSICKCNKNWSLTFMEIIKKVKYCKVWEGAFENMNNKKLQWGKTWIVLSELDDGCL